MMIVDLIDEQDILDKLQEILPDMDKSVSSDIQTSLEKAAQLADETQWQTLNQWLFSLCKEPNLLLPEIKLQLSRPWYKDRTPLYPFTELLNVKEVSAE